MARRARDSNSIGYVESRQYFGHRAHLEGFRSHSLAGKDKRWNRPLFAPLCFLKGRSLRAGPFGMVPCGFRFHPISSLPVPSLPTHFFFERPTFVSLLACGIKLKRVPVAAPTFCPCCPHCARGGHKLPFRLYREWFFL